MTGSLSDRLLQLPEISERTTLSVDSLRWLRHVGRGPKTFKLGRRVVAYESDVLAWIDAQRARETTTDRAALGEAPAESAPAA